MPTIPWWQKWPVTLQPEPDNGFVDLNEYDTQHKFPTQSSRVPSEVASAGCEPCSPTLIVPAVPDPEPDPEVPLPPKEPDPT